MATLIQSKQIQGIVTASVIQGNFSVAGGGLVDLSAASSVTGSFTGSFLGDGTNLTFRNGMVSGSSQILLSDTDGFTAFSSSIASQFSTVDTDDQTLSFNQASKILSIGDGNSVDLSTLGGGGGGGSSIWTISGGVYKVSANLEVTGSITATSFTGSIDYSNLINIPTLISGSSQITSSLDLRYALSGSGGGGGDVTSLNDYTSSTDLRLTNLESTTSSLDTRITQLSNSTGSYEVVGRGIISSSEQFPSGIVSSSVQILGGTGILSGSHTQIPQGTISGSKQITDLGFISSSHTDISSLNTYTCLLYTSPSPRD